MTEPDPDAIVIDFVDRYLTFLSDGGDAPDINTLPEGLRGEVFRQLRVLDEFEPEPYPLPPLDSDRVAKRFGFGRRGTTITISTAALKDAARDASVPFSELAKRLTASGRPTQAYDLLRLANSATADIDRDLAARLAAILNTSIADLEASSARAAAMTLDDYLVSDEARAFIDVCARELGMPLDHVRFRARELVAAAAFRNRTHEAWRDAVLAALNRIRNERRQQHR